MGTILVIFLIAVVIPCACIPYWVRQGRLRAASVRQCTRQAIELSPAFQQKLAADRAHQLALEKVQSDRLRFDHQVHTDLARLWIETHYLPAERYIVNTEVSNVMALPSLKREQIKAADQQQPDSPSSLPTYVRYEDVRYQVPTGHVLVGVGQAGIDTREERVGACVWIVGLSGTGKTSTTVIRVEERQEKGHKFLGVDPHWFKDESLFHAIYETLDGAPGPYASRFLLPMAKTPAESLQVLHTFLGEFQARKGGQRPKPWQRITLLVDELGSQMDKATATTPEEKEIIELLPSIARICGQEARNFEMGGIFISQQATGLAWLRKVALMVIVHQLLQESEKKLATNEDVEVMKAMKTWPIGRTYVYGVGFADGPRTVQQPYFKPAIVEADPPGTLYQPVQEPVHESFSGTDNISFFRPDSRKKETPIGTPVLTLNPLPEQTEQGTDRVPTTPDDKQFTMEQEAEFIRRYKACGSIKEVLSQMHLSYGRYQRCASRVVKERGLRRA